MPLSGGTSGAHDDSMHQGSAKRDVAEGLAGLDVGGHVLAPGYRFTAARGAAEQITIRERTSDERVVRFIRIGADDYEARVNVGGVEKVVQHEGMKDVVNGLAALDAAGALLVPGSKIYYTRDGSNDVHIYERTSDEEAYAFHRVGADDYTMFVKESNVWKQMQTESMKDAVNGIAGLGATGQLLVPGNSAYFTRNVGNQVVFFERTSGNPILMFERLGANDFKAELVHGGAYDELQLSSDKDAANGIAGLDGSAKVNNDLYAGIEKTYVISDNLLHSNDAAIPTSSTSYVKTHTITIDALNVSPSVLRIKFDMMTYDGLDSAQGQIYKNGASVGTERTTNSSTPVTFSEDLSFAQGDLLQLYCRRVAPNTISYVEKFRVYGDEDDILLSEAIVDSNVGLVDPFAATNSTP